MEWNEVKSKPKKQKKATNNDNDGFYGGMQGNHLRAGPVKQAPHVSHGTVNKQASAIADYDYLRDDDGEEIKYEKVSMDCAKAIQKARLEKEMTQAQLAKAINEKTGTVVEIESGEASYNPDVINRIEKALGVKIPRGRGTKKNKKKKPAQPTF